MRSAIALGVRLALRASRPGRMRAAMVAAAGAAGTLTILSVLAVAAADRENHPERYVDGGMRRLFIAIVVIISLQVAGLAAVAGRLSAAMRSRRLANLRLLGLTAGRTRVVAASEVAVAAAGGAAVALAAFPVMQLLLARLRLGGDEWSPSALHPGTAAFVVVPILVTASTVVLAVAPERFGMRRGLEHARRAEPVPPSWWRLSPLVVGVASGGYLQASGRSGDGAAGLMLASVILLGVGTVLVVPIFVRLVAALMVRRSTRATLLIAGRRLQDQPAAINRVVTGLLLGLFLVVGGRAVIVEWENLPQYVGAHQQLTERQRADTTVTAADVHSTIAAVRAVDEVRQVIAYPILTTGCDSVQVPCQSAMVATCEQLVAIDPTATGCRDGEVMAVTEAGLVPVAPLAPDIGDDETSAGAATTETRWMPQRRYEADRALSVLIPNPRNSADASNFNAPADIIIPPTWPGVEPIAELSDHRIVVLGDPGRGLAERLADAAAPTRFHGIWDMAEYDFILQLRTIVYAVAVVITGVGLLAFAIATIDRAIARRRELTSLRLVGVPARTLRRAQCIEALVPIAGGGLLAIALGHLAGTTYLTWGGGGQPAPWQPAGVLAAAALLGGVFIAALTVIATNQPIDPDNIRTE
jgi:putative ABC transport system permease protein